MKNLYENLVEENLSLILKCFFYDIYLITINDKSYTICEGEITKDNLFVALKTIPNNNGNDNLSK